MRVQRSGGVSTTGDCDNGLDIVKSSSPYPLMHLRFHVDAREPRFKLTQFILR
jgi:hypothetical protein